MRGLNKWRARNIAARAFFGVIATTAFANALQGQVTDAYDDGLLVTDREFVGGPNGAPSTHSVDWLKIETDSCGFPKRAQNRQSLLTQSGLDDDLDQPETLEGLDDLAPADQAWALVAMSLSGHSDIAVISDGVGKTCDDGPLDDEDTGAEGMAAWHHHVFRDESVGRRAAPTGRQPYIA